MKTLKCYIIESLIEYKNTDITQPAVEEYINTNYEIKGKLTVEDINGVCIVNCDGDITVKNKGIEKLTDGFKWGKVKKLFNCSNCNNLKTLEGSPEEAWDFYCASCRNLKSLEGGPKLIRSRFDCSNCNNLRSIEGAPRFVGGNFICSWCENLESLKGAPREINKTFNCDHCNSLKSLV